MTDRQLKQLKKIFKFLLIATVITYFILFLLIGNLTHQNPVETSHKNLQEVPLPEEEQKEEQTEEQTEEITTLSIFNKIHNKKVEDVEIIEFPDNGLRISYTIPEFFTANSLVSDIFSKYVIYCKALYESFNYDYVEFVAFVLLVDKKGNPGKTKALMFKMYRDEFNTFNWENLKYTPIYDTFSESCESFDIDISLLNTIKKEKIYYTGY